MARCMDHIKTLFPAIDEHMYHYIDGVLENGVDDFQSGEEIYEAIGEVLLQLDDSKSESDIMNLCTKICSLLKPPPSEQCNGIEENGLSKQLSAPIQLRAAAEGFETTSTDVESIWLMQKNYSLKVDQKKLAKANAKQQQKLEKRDQFSSGSGGGRIMPPTANSNQQQSLPPISSASASQVTSKKEAKMEAKGNNRSQDIRIENFDVSFGDRVLLQNADLTLSYGRRYGLVGRNGLGKTTLLRMISSGQLRIPSHISVLHVEQEVVGDDTPALDSVLECDVIRSQLLAKEKQLTLALNTSSDAALNAELNEVYGKLESIDADKAPAKVSVILAGLGFTAEMQKRPTKEFSGGWRMRLALARALFSSPDLLLLDEPTNMLDMKAIIWLENYLQTWPKTLLVVSHDRHFLDTVPTDILHFHSQRIDCYRGNYEIFEKTKTEKLKNQQREIEAQQAQRQHVQEFIDKFRYNANRASSVQSKIKMLEKLPELKPIEKEPEVVLKFPDTDQLSPPIIQIDEVSFRYSSDSSYIFKNVNLGANLDSRICIVGDNGAGKTTLLKLIMGILTPTSGTLRTHRNLKFGYFSQHHVDQLDMNMSSVELLQNTLKGRPAEEYRRHLGAFGLSGDLALQPIGSLSGGQKSRIAFAKMCLSLPNFLILDEPTNHLDIESIEALGKAIQKYTGGVILVSHDERLIRKVCKELWVCAKSTVKSIEGGFDEYRKIVEKELAEVSK